MEDQNFTWLLRFISEERFNVKIHETFVFKHNVIEGWYGHDAKRRNPEKIPNVNAVLKHLVSKCERRYAYPSYNIVYVIYKNQKTVLTYGQIQN